MRKVLLILVTLVAILAIIGIYLVWGPAVKNPDKKFLYIPTGATIVQVKDSMKAHSFLENFGVFDKVASWYKLPENIKPGKYKVDNGMSIFNLVKKLRTGRQETVNLVITKLRIPEDLAKRISRNFELDSVSVMDFLTSNDSLLSFNVDTNTALTDVIPDTYSYFWTADMRTIFKKLFDENQKFWNEERLSKAQRLGLSPTEVYILSSIVEEETNKQDDKGKVASVYINRLRKGNRLEADPTVKFALKNFALTRILHGHLDVVSPYNTYRNTGLPPGPICTPSRKTLEAVLDAPETNYMFFVAKPDFSGYSNFAANYTEHLIYARAYRKALDSLIRAKQEKQKSTSE